MNAGTQKLVVAVLCLLAVLWLALQLPSASKAQTRPGDTAQEYACYMPLVCTPHPDKIAFLVSPPTGGSKMYVMDANGSGVANLTEDIDRVGIPIWSPDGSKIAFENMGVNDEVYVMNSDGSNRINVTNNPGIDANPSWSPDGSKLVFERWGGDGTFASVELYTVNADGTSLTQLTNNSIMDYLPSWSPDGQKIAFKVYVDDTQAGIRVMDIASANVITVTDATYRVPQEIYWVLWQGDPPAWSPDSSKIAFVDMLQNGSHEIYVVNADGTGLTNLTKNAADDKRPVWSPDGSKITFASMRDGNAEVYVMNADGGNPVRLTADPASDSFPTWAPDGSRLAFWSERSDQRGIYVMNADGSQLARLTSQDLTVFFPKWAPWGNH